MSFIGLREALSKMALVVIYLWNTHKVMDWIYDFLRDRAYKDYDSEGDLFGFEERDIEDGIYFQSGLTCFFGLMGAGVVDSLIISGWRALYGF